MTYSDEVRDRLSAWLRTELSDTDSLRVEGLDRVEFGHSAEMMVLTIVTGRGGGEARRDVVVRLRPRPPALLEPYDLTRQFTVLRALEGTPVRVPRALWLEESGEVLGRPFFVMERVPGTVYEMEGSQDRDVSSDGVRRMCESMAEQLAAIHTVDLVGVQLDSLDDGGNHLGREIDHWAGDQGHELPWLRTPSGMRRKPEDAETASRRAQFIVSAVDQFAGEMPPVFQRLGELYATHSLDIIALFNEGERTLIHGDTHSGNLFVDAGRRGFYDWAVAGRGPGMRDVAYFLCNSLPVETRRAEEVALVARYRAALAAKGMTLYEHTADEQYRLFAVYSWIAAASTAAMGPQWQPIDVSRAATVSTTQVIEDLDSVGLLEERLRAG